MTPTRVNRFQNVPIVSYIKLTSFFPVFSAVSKYFVINTGRDKQRIWLFTVTNRQNRMCPRRYTHYTRNLQRLIKGYLHRQLLLLNIVIEEKIVFSKQTHAQPKTIELHFNLLKLFQSPSWYTGPNFSLRVHHAARFYVHLFKVAEPKFSFTRLMVSFVDPFNDTGAVLDWNTKLKNFDWLIELFKAEICPLQYLHLCCTFRLNTYRCNYIWEHTWKI